MPFARRKRKLATPAPPTITTTVFSSRHGKPYAGTRTIQLSNRPTSVWQQLTLHSHQAAVPGLDGGYAFLPYACAYGYSMSHM